MTRFELEDWIDYIQGRIPSEKQAEMEEALLTSDEAMELYMHAFEMSRFQLPKLSCEHLTDTIMAAITGLEQSDQSEPLEQQEEQINHSEQQDRTGTDPADATRPNHWLHHPLFHYTVAAAITMILFASGLFEQMLQVIPSDEPTAGSITDQLMNHATSLLDALKPE